MFTQSGILHSVVAFKTCSTTAFLKLAICQGCIGTTLHLDVLFNSFTTDSSKSKIDKFSKIRNWLHLRVLSIES